MGGLTIVIFVGITALALITKVHVAADASQLVGAPDGYAQKTVIAQVAGAVFGLDSLGFYAVQAFTAAILIMAANTAFNGFPILASILANDRFLPRQMSRRGDRLVFSNGVVILAAFAIGLLWFFDANTTRLIQLYIIGVFASFTLSQAGMVRHWLRLRPRSGTADQRRLARSLGVNALGAATTMLVLVIVLITKFTHGAWIVVIAMPLLFAMMTAVRRHYDRVAGELPPPRWCPTAQPRPRDRARVQPADAYSPRLAYARATEPSTLTAVTAQTSDEDTEALVAAWEARASGAADGPRRSVP